MNYRRLGTSDLEVSALAFGAWQLGDAAYWGEVDDSAAERTIAAAIDGGINLFDTAEIYGGGESERALGKALGDKREKVLIASKVSPEHCAPKDLRASCEASLERLGTDRIDLYQIHWPFRAEPFVDQKGEDSPGVATFAEAYGELQALKSEGKIRAIGVSNFGPTDLSSWLDAGDAVSNQIGYNLLFRAPEYELIPVCRRKQVGVLAYMPLMQGLLTGKFSSVEEIPQKRRRTRHFSGDREGARHGESGCEELLMDTVHDLQEFAEAVGLDLATVAIAWLTMQPGVSSVITGARSPEQIEHNIRAATLDLGPAAIAQINELAAALKRQLGRNCDLWQGQADCRVV